MIDQEMDLIPYKKESELKTKLKEERKQTGIRSEEYRAIQNELVNLYVSYGESFKFAEEAPNWYAAKKYFYNALTYQPDHSIANYRYGHLLYKDKEYTSAACYFKKAIDGRKTACLDDTQRLIANIYIVNCGLMMAKEAVEEVEEIQGYPQYVLDEVRSEQFLNEMLVDSKEMIERHIYIKEIRSNWGYEKESISQLQYLDEKEASNAQEVKVCITLDERVVRFEYSEPYVISKTEYYILNTLLMSRVPMTNAEIVEAHSQDNQINEVYVRKCISRLSGRIPFWDNIVDTTRSGNTVKRGRRQGITYKLLRHCIVV